MEVFTNSFRNGSRRRLSAITDFFKKLMAGRQSQSERFAVPRLCPFCKLITPRGNPFCLECGKSLKEA
jgi:hypothetical protein